MTSKTYKERINNLMEAGCELHEICKVISREDDLSKPEASQLSMIASAIAAKKEPFIVNQGVWYISEKQMEIIVNIINDWLNTCSTYVPAPTVKKAKDICKAYIDSLNIDIAKAHID